MKIAVISDIHGNIWALNEVLSTIDKMNVDEIICLGDFVNPLDQATEVYSVLKKKKITILKGNHEDYFIRTKQPEQFPLICKGYNFLPTRLAAQTFGDKNVESLKSLPFDKVIKAKSAESVYFCHASPLSNTASFQYHFDDALKQSINKVPQNILISGHIHNFWQAKWNDKLLVVVGSVGLPLGGRPYPQFVILEFLRGEWRVHFETVNYDRFEVAKSFKESGKANSGGPISWLLYLEFLYGFHHVGPFLKYVMKKRKTLEIEPNDWILLVREFLKYWGSYDLAKEIMSVSN